ncbi:PA0069 family radical SAM protein [Humisphaera borealis]|uniref:PA0069 family radical SAM protein n=1 Tax=Humisphaera borealis TaxID=2807512 RepID=A0A7M2WQC4_9BACT|nr:PA0069 family radical SAM protein [Humisphaera borealis]QOV87735.1 PA0069 family radical SAM protein [Humisphaera borealis]
MSRPLPVISGRAAQANPLNRFETLKFDREMEHWEHDAEAIEELGKVPTQYLVDSTRAILARNDSPDIGFSVSINPYRGCEHGCIYCYARPTHEYLGFSSGLDFETRIMVKPNAPKLLREALADPKYEPDCIAISGVTDCYQPIERQLKITRGCLEVLLEAGNPAGIVTKSALVTRDIDILSEMAKKQLIAVYISVTSLDIELSRKMEPRAPSPKRRLEAIAKLSAAGVPVGVITAPVVPGLTDHEVPAILKAAADAGARFGGYVPLRLPFQVKDLFADWLEQHFPDRKDKVLNRVREMRGGKLNDSNFNTRMTGQGVWADELRGIYLLGHRKAGLGKSPPLSIDHFKRPAVGQLLLW